MSKREQILAVFKPGVPLGKADIARASGVDIGMAGYYLRQLVDEGTLTGAGATGNRKFALAGTAIAADSPPSPAATKPPGKRASKKGRKPAKKAAAASAPAAACNVTPFTPAMTIDQRMLIVGGSEPLIFSVEQTQSIADLIFGNFEAN